MLVMGDECGRTQHGNNNGYNQDNEISWMDWDWNEKQQALFEFTSQLTALRQEIPFLSRRSSLVTNRFRICGPKAEK